MIVSIVVFTDSAAHGTPKYTVDRQFIKGKKKPQAETWGRLHWCLYGTWVERIMQVDLPTSRLTNTVQYSNSSLNNLNNSNSTVDTKVILSNISDLVHEGYEPFYAKHLRKLGPVRFMELANKARAASDTPQRLFSWMLKNNEIVN